MDAALAEERGLKPDEQRQFDEYTAQMREISGALDAQHRQWLAEAGR